MLLVIGSDVALGEEETTFSVDEMFNKDLTPKIQGPSTRKIQLEADSRSYIEAPLGSNELQLKSSIKSGVTVYAGGEMINRSDFDIVDIEAKSDFDTIEKTTVSYTVVHKNPSLYESVRVTDHRLHVEYYRGTAVIGQNRFTRHIAGFNTIPLNGNRDQVQLVASSVLGRDNDAISTGNELYYKVDLFQPPADQKDVIIENDMNGDKGYSANANERKQDALKKWDNNTTVKTGDVLRTWSADSKEDGYYYGWSDIPKNPAPESGYMYYYLYDGYLNSFKFNSLKPRERIIAQNASDEYLKATIWSSFENGTELKKNFSEVKFKKLPDREKEGKTTAEITIKEQIYNSGKFYEHTIEVPFDVVEPSIEIDEENMHFPVGTDVELSNPSEFIKTIYQYGEEADIDDFDVNVYPVDWYDYDNETVGHAQKMILEINSKRWYRELVFGDIIDFDFIWGNTLANKGVGSNDYDASVSLLKNKNNKPYLSANNGEGLTGNTSTKPKVAVYSESDTKEPKIKEETNDGKRAEDVKNDFQSAFSNHGEFEYGDVLVYGVSNETEILSAKEEELVNEAKDFKEAYYELTPDGYHLLRLNQMKVKGDTIELVVGDDMNRVTEKLKAGLIIPSDLESGREIRYEADSSTVDVSKPSTNKKATINVYEKLDTDEKEFMTTYEIPYEVAQNLDIELQQTNVPVGTKASGINANDYVKTVKSGDKILNPSEYTASFETTPNTMKVGTQKTSIKVEIKENNNSIVKETTTNIIWGHTIGSSKDGTDKTPIDISVSMLHDAQNPYLVANDGNGLNPGDIRYRTTFYVYRGANTQDNRVFYSPSFYPGGQAFQTRDLWNDGGSLYDGTGNYPGFKNTEFHYGDVAAYQTSPSAHPVDGELSEKMWASRDEKLVKESVGYQTVYYEMTKDGFNVLRLNQLEVNPNLVTVDLGTEKSEMDKLAKNTMIIPKHITNKDDYRFEFASVDTKTSGKKKTKVNVYEKLVSGGEFRTQYDVEYIVNSQVTETYVSETGTKLKEPKVTNVELGKEYQGQPDNFVTYNSEVYSYKGWLPSDKTPGKDKPTPGNPPVAKDTTTYQYIYEKADNLINMTIPTELLFGTEENSNKIASKNYKIINNSKDVKTDVVLDTFETVKSDVTLLGPKDQDPSKQQVAARFNLMADQQPAISSLTEKTTNETIKSLEPQKSTDISLSGLYFGPLEDSLVVDYQMHFKFKVVSE